MDILTAAIEARIAKFRDRISAGLIERGIGLAVVADTDWLLATAARCARLAAESPDSRFADALVRFAIEIVVTPSLVTETEVGALVTALERLTYPHLLLLQFCDCPQRWLAASEQRLNPDTLCRGTFTKFLQAVLPGLLQPPELIGSIEQTLRSCGLLIEGQFKQSQDVAGLLERKTSEAGRLLVALTLSPLTVPEKKPTPIGLRPDGTPYPPCDYRSKESIEARRAEQEKLRQQGEAVEQRRRAEREEAERIEREHREAIERRQAEIRAQYRQ